MFNDTSNLSGEKRIYSMYFDSVREQLLTGSSIIDIWPLTRAVHNTIQIPQSHQQPISAVSRRSYEIIFVGSELIMSTVDMTMYEKREFDGFTDG